MSRFTRRQFLASAGLTLTTAALAAACSAAQSQSTPTGGVSPNPAAAQPYGGVSGSLIGPTVLPTVVSSPVKGKWLVVEQGNLYVFDLSTLQAQPLTQFPKGAYAASPSMSHDRKQIVYTYYVIPKDPKDLGGSDLFQIEANGSNPRSVQTHPSPGATFEDPCWSADGTSIYSTLRTPTFDSAGKYQGESLGIYHVGLDGGKPVQIVKDALGPATSPDGKYLAYAGVDSKGQPSQLFVADPDGKNAKQLVADQNFVLLRAPNFSPDSSLICFAGVGGPGGALPGQKAPGAQASPFFDIAEAHGIPWDIFTVRPDGTNLQRLTYESEDTPTPVWSPSGDWVAFAGEIGLYLVDSGGKKTIRVSTIVSGGGIAWLG